MNSGAIATTTTTALRLILANVTTARANSTPWPTSAPRTDWIRLWAAEGLRVSRETTAPALD